MNDKKSSYFSRKNALIYGGGKGIGRAIAVEFANRGARLAIADIDPRAASEAAAIIRDNGGHAIDLHCDVTSEDSVRDAAESAELSLDDIDIVVNNVGVILSGNPEDIPFSEWQRIVDLNLYPVVRSNEVFLPRMLARGSGHIVNTASIAGLFPYAANRLPYVATKAAVIALSESLALYTMPQGVKVSCFCPGPTITTVSEGMKTWSENVAMRGPGREFELMTADQAAVKLAEGMEAGNILIPAHEVAWDRLRQHAANPNAFIQQKMDAFAAGDPGLPAVPEWLKKQ